MEEMSLQMIQTANHHPQREETDEGARVMAGDEAGDKDQFLQLGA